MAMPLPIAVGSRRNTMSKYGNARSGLLGSLPSPPASLPTQKFVMGADGTVTHVQDSAIDDEQNDRSSDEAERAFQKARIRRASDGQPLVKEGRKSNRPELRCEKCGKGYKHSSCLTKHLFVPQSPFQLSPSLRSRQCATAKAVLSGAFSRRTMGSAFVSVKACIDFFGVPGGSILPNGRSRQNCSSRSTSRSSCSRPRLCCWP